MTLMYELDLKIFILRAYPHNKLCNSKLSKVGALHTHTHAHTHTERERERERGGEREGETDAIEHMGHVAFTAGKYRSLNYLKSRSKI